KSSTNVPSRITLNGEIAETGPEIYDLFKHHFMGVFEREQFTCDSLEDVDVLNGNILRTLQFDEAEVMKRLSGIDSIKGSGPSFLCKNCATSLCTPLLLLFNQSLKS
ncbi:hypothetical protein HHI36_010463, partial [Cryptolaemus montrouzieri]